MGIWEIIVGALVLLFSIVMIIVIILQEGHEAGLGTITGGADSFLSRGKARTADAIFARVTKYCAIAFFVLVVLLNAMQYFGFTGAAKETPTTETSQNSVVSEVSEESSKTSKEESKKEESKTESKTESSAESKAESSEGSKAESSVESKAESSEGSKAESSVESKTESSVVSTTESSVATSSAAVN